jgi:hypothetical protein
VYGTSNGEGKRSRISTDETSVRVLLGYGKFLSEIAVVNQNALFTCMPIGSAQKIRKLMVNRSPKNHRSLTMKFLCMFPFFFAGTAQGFSGALLLAMFSAHMATDFLA